MNTPTVVIVAMNSAAEPDATPLGAASICSALARCDGMGADNVRLLKIGSGAPAESALGEIAGLRPSIAGFSLYCWNRKNAVALASRLKETIPGLCVIAGGPDAEGLVADGDIGAFDAIFLGEAEEEVVKWFHGWMLKKEEAPVAAAGSTAAAGQQAAVESAAGASAPGAAPVIRCGPCAADALPSPWLDGFAGRGKTSSIAWELARGCAYHCAYCYEGRGGSGVRYLPRERVEKELRLFSGSGTSEVFVLDPTFNMSGKRALSLLELLGREGKGIHWNFEVRAELIDEAQAEAFSGLDCSVQIGLQSSDDKVLRKIGRGIDKRKFSAKIGLLNRAGVVFGLDLIYGLPGDSLKGFRNSLDYALSLYPNHLDIFPLAVIPGTELYDKRESFGLVADPEPPYLLKSHPSFPEGDMEKADRLAKFCTLFYSDGRAVPWFCAVLSPLRLSPSRFLSDAMRDEGLDTGKGDPRARRESARDAKAPQTQADIEEMQCGILARAYARAGKESLLPAALDLVRYNGALSRAWAENETTRLELSYPLREIESPEALDIERFCDSRRPGPCRVEIGPGKDGPLARALGKRA